MYFTRQYDRNPVSLAIFAKIVKVWVQKKFLIKQSLLKFMAQVLQFLILLKLAFFFWTSVESSEYVKSLT